MDNETSALWCVFDIKQDGAYVDIISLAPEMAIHRLNDLSQDKTTPTPFYINLVTSLNWQCLGNIYDRQILVNFKKCTCPILELMNLGCKCGGQ
jgi:hypothetical protein